MAKTIFQNGTKVTAAWLNSFRQIFFDGADLDGHYPPLTDSALSTEPGNIRSEFSELRDALKASIVSGLTIKVKAGKVTLQNGSIVAVPETQLTLQNNKTTFISVDTNGQLVTALSPPESGVFVARVVTSGGAISILEDARPRVNFAIGPITVPAVVQANPIPSGATMTFMGDDLPTGWLWCDGSTLLRSQYPALFAAIKTIHGSTGPNNFKLPDSRGKVLLGADIGRPLGTTGGANTVTLNAGNMPLHGHTVNDAGHGHAVLDTGHGHSVNDSGHGHPLLISNFSSDSAVDGLNNANTGIGGEYAGTKTHTFVNGSGQELIQKQTTGISLTGSVSNVSIVRSTAGITIAPTGGSDPISIVPPYIACNQIIKI
jgi:microcystin-dependent protein